MLLMFREKAVAERCFSNFSVAETEDNVVWQIIVFQEVKNENRNA
jgi:hypothetical protein